MGEGVKPLKTEPKKKNRKMGEGRKEKAPQET